MNGAHDVSNLPSDVAPERVTFAQALWYWLGIAAFIALLRYKVDVIHVIAASGAIGLALTFLQ